MAKKLSNDELNNVNGGCGGKKENKVYYYIVSGAKGTRKLAEWYTDHYESISSAKAERDDKVAKMFASYPEVERIGTALWHTKDGLVDGYIEMFYR